jgi:cold shock CspA family protein/ribosome-associated translation inhibitor RaiA
MTTKLPIQITCRNLTPTEELESMVRERAARLDAFCRSIMACRVAIEVPHRHHQEGNRYHVRIDLTVPGEEIVVTHEPSLYSSLQDLGIEEVTKDTDVDAVHKHVQVAVREAFDVARRRLQDYARRQRGAVKAHEAPLHGRVIRLMPEEAHGWIQTPDGREVYFHQRSVLDDGFTKLDIGSEVAFVEEPGEKGPQASTVRVLGKHHYV